MSLRVASFALAVAVSSAAQAGTLYDDLGAKPGVDRLVAEATSRFTTDPRIAPLFEETNLQRFQVKLAEQICSVTDGGCTYTGRSMRDSHKGLHLNTKQFNVLVEDLQDAMGRVGIPFSTQNRLLAVLAPMYREVIEK